MIALKDIAKVVVLLILFIMATSVTFLNITQTYVEGKAIENGEKINCLDESRRLRSVVCTSRSHKNGRDFCEGECSYISENCTIECTGCQARR